MKPDTEFAELFYRAREVQFAMANNLQARGHCVRLMTNALTPNRERRFEYTDEGDLELRMRVEVKHWPTIDFHSLDDVPYANIIVDTAHSLELPREMPVYGYTIVNASMTGYLLIPAWTRGAWFKERRHDRRENKDREFYFCPKDKVFYQGMRA